MKRPGDLKLLVCGGRDYADRDTLNRVLDRLHAAKPIGLLIHGACSGADLLAEDWAKRREIMYCGVPAPWRQNGRKAGPMRNSYMLDILQPDLVVGFPGDVGTRDTLTKSHAAGIAAIDVRNEQNLTDYLAGDSR